MRETRGEDASRVLHVHQIMLRLHKEGLTHRLVKIIIILFKILLSVKLKCYINKMITVFSLE